MKTKPEPGFSSSDLAAVEFWNLVQSGFTETDVGLSEKKEEEQDLKYSLKLLCLQNNTFAQS